MFKTLLSDSCPFFKKRKKEKPKGKKSHVRSIVNLFHSHSMRKAFIPLFFLTRFTLTPSKTSKTSKISKILRS